MDSRKERVFPIVYHFAIDQTFQARYHQYHHHIVVEMNAEGALES